MRQNISEPGNKGGKLRVPLIYTDFPSQRTFEVCSFVPIVYNEPTSAQGSSVDDSVPLFSNTTPEIIGHCGTIGTAQILVTHLSNRVSEDKDIRCPDMVLGLVASTAVDVQ